MARPSKYSEELRERAVRMVAEIRPDYPSQWAAICAVTSKLGIYHPPGPGRAPSLRCPPASGPALAAAQSTHEST